MQPPIDSQLDGGVSQEDPESGGCEAFGHRGGLENLTIDQEASLLVSEADPYRSCGHNLKAHSGRRRGSGARSATVTGGG